MRNLFLAIVVMGLGALLSYLLREDAPEKESKPSFQTLTGVNRVLKPVMGGAPNGFNGKTVLMLFNSECEHCQEEIASIVANLDKFDGIQLWFVSFEEEEAVSYFLLQKGVMAHNASYSFWIDPEIAFKTFGPLKFPQTFVYQDNQLLTSFLGNVEIETMLDSFK